MFPCFFVFQQNCSADQAGFLTGHYCFTKIFLVAAQQKILNFSVSEAGEKDEAHDYLKLKGFSEKVFFKYLISPYRPQAGASNELFCRAFAFHSAYSGRVFLGRARKNASARSYMRSPGYVSARMSGDVFCILAAHLFQCAKKREPIGSLGKENKSKVSIEICSIIDFPLSLSRIFLRNENNA
jgi:hypothetical protein